MNPLPVPSKWIGWALAGLCAVCFALALTCPAPSPHDPAVLTHATDTRKRAVAVDDSVRSRAKIAHASSNIRVKLLQPLRARITLTPNAVIVDGRDSLSGVGVGVVAKVLASQDTALASLEHTVATQDTALHADSLALRASLHETDVAKSLIPSKWSRVVTAAKWLAVGIGTGYVLHAVVR